MIVTRERADFLVLFFIGTDVVRSRKTTKNEKKMLLHSFFKEDMCYKRVSYSMVFIALFGCG